MRLKSIRTKITALTLVAILVSVTAIGSIGVSSIRRLGDQASEKEMTLLCENLQQSIDQYLLSVDQSVDMIARYAIDELDVVPLAEGGVTGSDGTGNSIGRTSWDTPQQEKLDQYLKSYCASVERVFRSLANHTNGVIAFYYRLNQELTNNIPSQGFLYSRAEDNSFRRVQVTDVSAFDRDDVEHVGWYYIPLERGGPTWMSPYYNDNLGIEMFSYVCPIFKAGTFIGVIGMDISYETLVNRLAGAKVFDTGFVCVLDEKGNLVYHPSFPGGTPVTELNLSGETDPMDLFGLTESETLFSYTIHGSARKAAFSTLNNGCKLVVTAPADEINARWLKLVYRVILASLVILVLFLSITLFIVQQITEPLQRLTVASRHIAAGDYDIELDYRGDDEVGVLTASVQQLVRNLKVYIADLNSKAYSDALTGVKNKGAFDIFAHKLNDQIKLTDPKDWPRFALVMMDCNDLKLMNDAFGHDKGDLYLRSACSLICHTFQHSPVFRLGGDEFVALLQNQDFDNRDALLQQFQEQSQELSRKANHPWETVSIAVGMALFHPKLYANVESVLKRADDHMYQNKREIKGKR